MRRILSLGTLCVCLTMNVTARPSDLSRYPFDIGPQFPVSRAVVVPNSFELIFHSGVGPQPLDAKAKKGSAAFWGDTRTQAMSAFSILETSAKQLGLGLGDIVKLNVYLVGDPVTGTIDSNGFMEAYKQFFGTKAQPNLPARATVQVSGLLSPGMLVEIEAIFARRRK